MNILGDISKPFILLFKVLGYCIRWSFYFSCRIKATLFTLKKSTLLHFIYSNLIANCFAFLSFIMVFLPYFYPLLFPWLVYQGKVYMQHEFMLTIFSRSKDSGILGKHNKDLRDLWHFKTSHSYQSSYTYMFLSFMSWTKSNIVL